MNKDALGFAAPSHLVRKADCRSSLDPPPQAAPVPYRYDWSGNASDA